MTRFSLGLGKNPLHPVPKPFSNESFGLYLSDGRDTVRKEYEKWIFSAQISLFKEAGDWGAYFGKEQHFRFKFYEKLSAALGDKIADSARRLETHLLSEGKQPSGLRFKLEFTHKFIKLLDQVCMGRYFYPDIDTLVNLDKDLDEYNALSNNQRN